MQDCCLMGKVRAEFSEMRHQSQGAVTCALQPGRHTLTKPTHFLAGFLPSGQQTLSIEAVTSMSADNVGIRFDSALTIQVKDPEKAVTMLGIASNTAGRQSSGRASQRAVVECVKRRVIRSRTVGPAQGS